MRARLVARAAVCRVAAQVGAAITTERLPSVQPSSHRPLKHTWRLPQALPQLPQLRGSDDRSVDPEGTSPHRRRASA